MTLEATQNAKSKLEKRQIFRPLSAPLRSDSLMPWLRNEVNRLCYFYKQLTTGHNLLTLAT